MDHNACYITGEIIALQGILLPWTKKQQVCLKRWIIFGASAWDLLEDTCVLKNYFPCFLASSFACRSLQSTVSW